ncbi:MAG: DUF2721 domain-containing protein [Polyangiaceae bacterium]
MSPDTPLTTVAHVIQLAVAPVFLLSSLGTFLGVLSTRLGRIVDRARVLEESRPPSDKVNYELGVLARRRRLVNRAITFGTVAALFVCVLIGAAFIGSFMAADASRFVAVLFVLAMVAFVGSLVTFLSEVLLSVSSTPIAESLEKKPR